MTNPTSPRPLADWLPWASVLLATVLFAHSYTQSVVVLDTARDLIKAIDMARFNDWPTLGPDIGGFFHTGPIWFYFLALPALSGSLLVVAWWVGLFAGLKFFLAYRLGTELLDRRLGLLWAMLLLLPGWPVINQLFIIHFNLLETLALLLLLMLYRCWQHGHVRHWYAAALVLGLGFHAHPSFLVLVVFFGPVLWRRWSGLSWRVWAFTALLFCLPLLPYLVDQWLNHFPDWQRFSQRDVTVDQIKAAGGAVEQPAWWQRLALTLGSLLVAGPQRVMAFVLEHKPSLGQLMTGLYWSVMLLVLMGAWRLLMRPTHRQWLGVMFAGLLLGMLGVIGLRSFTPFYMLLSLTPLLAGMMALCVHALATGYRSLLIAITLACLLLGSIPTLAFHQAYKHRQINLGPVMNVIEQPAADWLQGQNTLDAISLAEGRAASTLFCDQSSVVNGPFAAVLDMTSAALVHFFCDQYQLQLGGASTGQDQAVFIMHKSFWDRLQRGPEQWLTPSWGLTTHHQNHAPNTAVQLQPFDDYVHPPRTAMPVGEETSHTEWVESTDAPYLVITYLMPTHIRFKVDSVQANDQPLTPVMQNAVNQVYHCVDCGDGAVTWQIKYRTNHANAIDLNTLTQRARHD